MDMAYVGIKACGCIVAATVDNPQHKREVAKDIAGFIRQGLSVERITVERVRKELKRCECEDSKIAI
jgi:hypothetical protein